MLSSLFTSTTFFSSVYFTSDHVIFMQLLKSGLQHRFMTETQKGSSSRLFWYRVLDSCSANTASFVAKQYLIRLFFCLFTHDAKAIAQFHFWIFGYVTTSPNFDCYHAWVALNLRVTWTTNPGCFKTSESNFLHCNFVNLTQFPHSCNLMWILTSFIRKHAHAYVLCRLVLM